MADVILKAEHLKIGFFSERHSLFEKRKRNEVLKDLSFTMEKGEVLGLVGESGCGKSTLAKVILGLLKPDSGTVIVSGNRPQMVFQDPYGSLNPAKKIGWIMEEPLRIQRKLPGKERRQKVLEMLKKVGLDEKIADRYPNQLSGGQRQRVAFARALAPNPQLLLLDEPFAAIDAKIRTELRSWLKDMIEKLGITSIFVTHDQDEAIEVADEIIITNRGRIEQKGTPLEVYQNPDTAFTAGFFGQTSVIDDYQVFNHFEEVPGGEKAIVRPDFVKLTKNNEDQKYKSSATEGVVERVAFRGSSLELKVRVGNTTLSARRSLDEEPVREGEVVDVFVQRIFVTKGNEAVLLHNTAMVEDWLVI